MKKLLLVAILLCAYMHAAADTALDDYGMEWDYTLYDAVGGKIATDVRPHDMSTVTGSVTVPATLCGYEVKSLQVGAFIHCTALTSVSFECGIEEISSNAFYGCTSLGRVSIPSSVNAINSGAFSGCYNLSSITIPSNVTSISSTAFEGCTCLTSVTINSNFIMCNYDSSKSLKDVFGSQVLHYYIGRNVTKIGACAFYGCSRMSSVEINSSIEEIGFKAFYNCSNLTSITIPSSIKEIGDDAFSGCTDLASIVIPNSVTSIEAAAFRFCNSLTSVTVEMSTPLEINENVFYNRANATLYVPVGSKAAYEAADYWKEFKEIIEIGQGDANSDGEVNITDITYVIDKINDRPAADFDEKAADLNEDGEINITDVTLLLDIINGERH